LLLRLKQRLKIVILILGALAPAVACPEQPSRILKLGLGNFEPYFNKAGTGGLFTDIITEVFNEIPGYALDYQANLSNLRLISMLHSKDLDGAANVFKDQHVVACLSDPVFRFQDVAISLKRRKLQVDGVSDLEKYSIIAYQGATTFHNNEFRSVVADHLTYQETPKQNLQARMILSGRTDISVGDIYIFFHEALQLGEVNTVFEVHNLFPPIYSYMAFRDKQVCMDFNEGLRKLIESGEYEQIYLRHLQEITRVISTNEKEPK